MKAKRKTSSNVEESELVGVPHYLQGEADGLCVYYAMSMMLAALHPKWRLEMHDAPRGRKTGSPVFHGLRQAHTSERAFQQKLTDWFFNGITMTQATSLLNQYLQTKNGNEAVYFIRRKVRSRRVGRLKYSRKQRALQQTWNVNEVLTSLSWHLPVIVAGGHLGAHAVVAIGYQIKGAADRMICVLDPSAMRAEWRSTGELFVNDAEVIAPVDDQFADYRPARVFRKMGEIKFEQWRKELLAEQNQLIL